MNKRQLLKRCALAPLAFLAGCKISEPKKFHKVPEMELYEREFIEKAHEMRDVQGSDGNWNFDPYMHGMYNGMEFMLALTEDREPSFRRAPDVWLSGGRDPKTHFIVGRRYTNGSSVMDIVGEMGTPVHPDALVGMDVSTERMMPVGKYDPAHRTGWEEIDNNQKPRVTETDENYRSAPFEMYRLPEGCEEDWIGVDSLRYDEDGKIFRYHVT